MGVVSVVRQTECAAERPTHLYALESRVNWAHTVEDIGLWASAETLRAVMTGGPEGSDERMFLQRYLQLRDKNQSGSEALAELERLFDELLGD